MLDQIEKVLDAELKYTDARQGTQCRSMWVISIEKKIFYLIIFSDFEQEAGYPKQDTRFLDLSIRGLCTDDYGKVHDIDKDLIIGKNI
jgi:hypothetical protein